jgi:hypothetical protein
MPTPVGVLFFKMQNVCSKYTMKFLLGLYGSEPMKGGKRKKKIKSTKI